MVEVSIFSIEHSEGGTCTNPRMTNPRTTIPRLDNF